MAYHALRVGTPGSKTNYNGRPIRAWVPHPLAFRTIMTNGRSKSVPAHGHTIEQELAFVRAGLDRELESIDAGLHYLLPKTLAAPWQFGLCPGDPGHRAAASGTVAAPLLTAVNSPLPWNCSELP